MRFSALFQSRSPRPARDADRPVASSEAAPAPGAQAAPAAQDLPEDLDARVRMLGEWQVSEY
ncbi:MAG TPA: hypothetical protein VF522_08480 [Ramlibacter sp.]|uniref:hypothetical protein n=1 Tax=Ramlibacter sp. TaxID=1917967 RepID=UPI002ED2F8B0